MAAPKSLYEAVDESERKRADEKRKKRRKDLPAIPVTRGARRKALDDEIEAAGG